MVLKLNSARIRIRFDVFQISAVSSEGFHVMVVVGKKIYKKAHDRNTVRRRIYSIISRTLVEELAGNAVQIRVHKTGILEYTHEQLEQVLLDGLQKLGQRIKHTAK